MRLRHLDDQQPVCGIAERLFESLYRRDRVLALEGGCEAEHRQHDELFAKAEMGTAGRSAPPLHDRMGHCADRLVSMAPHGIRHEIAWRPHLIDLVECADPKIGNARELPGPIAD